MSHIPVLLPESVKLLLEAPSLTTGGVVVDATFGGGGHSRALLQESMEKVTVIAVDRDPAAVSRARSLLSEFPSRFRLLTGNYADLSRLLIGIGIEHIDGLLLDIGLSSFQLEDEERGFSFQSDGPLDMRMDPAVGQPAAEIVNRADVRTLTRIFRNFGEEPYAAAIARRIVKQRQEAPLRTTRELAGLVEKMVPAYKSSRRHPATRIFQALRIVVNDELGALTQVLECGLEQLGPGGRMVVIAYHSLEDRIVKRFFRQAARGCVCPPKVPVCVCGCSPRVKILTGRGQRPTDAEIARNPRSRSAVLRAVEAL
ncbi:MAG: 16S rRNA (cytosine(1402)-N(4))-methyltransferase RsmH [Deltaproteobacteria bacterium]|nr:16S rRNA (cytosine(1402)-N(4))-methyltransferase RsmH [Deltaproteobacteria bacterium]